MDQQTDHNRENLKVLLKRFAEVDYVHPEDIPDIDLYVDQVTTFVDSHLTSVKRTPDEKTLTKTMINNYTKNHVLPSPEKKKYSRDHVLLLIMIYYLKNFLSIKDIKSIFAPLNERFFDNEKKQTGKDTGHGSDHAQEDLSFFDIYSELVKLENKEAKALIKDLIQKYNDAESTFSDAPEEDREQLRTFSFICTLAFDVYLKKMMIEQLIDLM